MNTVHINVRRWFERTNGNTYFTARGYVDGAIVADIPFEYGYGSHGENVAWLAICKHQGIKDGGNFPSMYCRENDIACTVDMVDVRRKKDLH